MKPALLDVNVLLALAWPSHQHHREAHGWFARESRHGWATIPAVQVAFIRLSSNPAYTADAVSPREAAALLASLLAHPRHRTWAAPGAGDPAMFEKALGHHQANDAYLVAAAHKEGGRLVSFDRRLTVHDPSGRVVHVIAPDVGE